ncbi:MAG: hypothetical protein L3J71_16460 [Victivallaceae bacterium]|nr:hypothetical protein [Victivallaceae bacterium]
MDNAEKIDLVEQSLKQAYHAADFTPVIAESWRRDVMTAIYNEGAVEDIRIERTTVRLLHLSWVAAGIAACYIIVFSLFHNADNDDIEHDFKNLYNDNFITELIPGVSQ